jgi:hypothetical protein
VADEAVLRRPRVGSRLDVWSGWPAADGLAGIVVDISVQRGRQRHARREEHGKDGSGNADNAPQPAKHAMQQKSTTPGCGLAPRPSRGTVAAVAAWLEGWRLRSSRSRWRLMRAASRTRGRDRDISARDRVCGFRGHAPRSPCGLSCKCVCSRPFVLASPRPPAQPAPPRLAPGRPTQTRAAGAGR